MKDLAKKIKQTSYENELFNKIKENNDEIIDLKNKLYIMSVNDLLNKDLSTSKNLIDCQKEIPDNYSENFSYINEINKENNYHNSLSCSNLNCENKVKFICKKHCYKYFCDSCKKNFDNDFNSHQFEEIDENKENLKIEFVNSFTKVFKIYTQKVDDVLKFNNEEKPYPVLKSQNGDDLIQFLNEIYNYQIVNDNQDNCFRICEPIKISLIKTFRLDIPIMEIIDDDFLEDETNLIIKKLKIKYNQTNDYNNNIQNKIKLIVRNELLSNLKKIKEDFPSSNIKNQLINNQKFTQQANFMTNQFKSNNQISPNNNMPFFNNIIDININ